MNFDIPFMIWRKNFEIWIVLLRELPSCKDYLLLLSYLDLSPTFSSRLYNSTPKRYFYASGLLKCPTMLDITEKMNFDIPFMISRKNLESVEYFTKTVWLEMAPVSQLSQFFSAQDSVHGFIT